MSPVQNTPRQLAILGGYPAFPPGSSVPLIQVRGHRPKGDFSAVDAVLANEANEELQGPGVHAKDDSEDCKEVIVPATTVGATIEAVIEVGFEPVFVGVGPASWHLSYEGNQRAISNKTAAITTVDWLGTQCDLGPFRKLADEHGIPLISDSAQSFGATNGQPPSIGHAHATIYSLGYPKVLTGAGSGGLIVCSKSLVQRIEKDPTGILRREVLAEPNAFVCLRALESLIDALEKRGAVGKLYRQLLSGISGITFQRISTGLSTNHYQISLTIDAKAVGLNAKVLCNALKAENVHCGTDSMPCVGAIDKLASRGRVEGDLKHRRLLATTSVTLPISNMMTLKAVETVCGLIKLTQHKVRHILEANKSEVAPTAPRGSEDVKDLESKYRQHLVIHILDSANSMYSKVFVPRDYMLEHKISIDEFLVRFQSQSQSLNERVLAELRVDTIIGPIVILASHGAGHNSATLVAAMVKMLAQQATSVWTEGQEEADSSFIQRAHFDWMRRRLKMASAKDETLGKILQHKTVVLNGRELDGFDAVMDKLESHPVLAKIAPTVLSEIHGDLNIHNILSRLDPKDEESVALIDPRGVPLLADFGHEEAFRLLCRRRLPHTHDLTIQQHPGLDTTNGAALTLLPALASDKVVKKWIDQVEHHGARSFELRVRVGEAAHLVADCACALGRGTPWEVVPLFLLGLDNLNDVVNLLDGKAQLSVDNESVSYDSTSDHESADLGVAMIQRTLHKSPTAKQDWPYDVLEVSVKMESASPFQNLFRTMVGTYLPKETAIYLSTNPVDSIRHPRCVLIHPSDGDHHPVRSSPAGITTNFSLPGSFGISPLHLAVLQANQFPFPKPGRWVIENDPFFLLSRPLALGGDGCVPAGHEATDIGLELVLEIDIVLPRFMEREAWTQLSHQQGYGVDSHLVWDSAKCFEHGSPRVELANGGEKMAFYHYGSDSEYLKLLANVRSDARLNSLAYAGAAVQWLQRNANLCGL
ncbi:hypothetical protein V8C34DRAFT_300525 [Trichoderma compactum]